MKSATILNEASKHSNHGNYDGARRNDYVLPSDVHHLPSDAHHLRGREQILKYVPIVLVKFQEMRY